VKVPPSPTERTPPPPIPLAEPGARRSEERDFVPRYVALPPRREQGNGRRNLVGGVILLVVAVLLLAWAVRIAGSTAGFTVAVCLATATLLHVMARSRLFRQRNGVFVGWASVFLLGVSTVLLKQAWDFATTASPTASVVGAAAPDLKAAAPAAPAGQGTPLLHDAFPPMKNNGAAGLAVRITHDINVEVAKKTYRAKAGDVYPLADVGIGEMTVFVGEHEVTIPNSAASMDGEEKTDDRVVAMTPPPLPGSKGRAGEAAVPPPAAPPKIRNATADALQESQAEAVRRYPALGRKGSPENQLYLTARREQQFSGEREFFQDPNWPLNLAEILAEKEGWQRADQPARPAAQQPQGDLPVPDAPLTPTSP